MDTVKTFIPKDTADLGYSRWNLFVVGCGGTGSYIIPELARLWAKNELMRQRIGAVTIIDEDAVESKNVIRQRFVDGDVGKPKAQVLARRYGQAYGVDLGYVVKRLTADDFGSLIPEGSLREPTLVIAAVDTPASRREIHNGLAAIGEAYRQAVYWMDTGNGRDRGQVVWGNTLTSDKMSVELERPLAEYLPYPSVVFPELLEDPAEPTPVLDCAAAVQVKEQGDNINAFMGMVLVEMLRQFFEGVLTTHYVVVDLASMEMLRQPITNARMEEIWSRMP